MIIDVIKVLFACGFFFFLDQSIGAVNCVIRRPDGKLVGCNTDYVGAISAIEDGLLGFCYDLVA